MQKRQNILITILVFFYLFPIVSTHAETISESGIIFTLDSDIPVIITQPASRMVSVGEKVALNVVASGATSYVWYTKKSDATTWYETTKTTATYSLTAGKGHNGMQYKCKVSNASGSVFTDTVTLTVVPEPIIITQPISQTVNVGDKVTFKVVATGAKSYVWYYKELNDTFWLKASKTTASYSLTAQEMLNGSQYKCKLSNDEGFIWSDIVVLTVNEGNNEYFTAPILTQNELGITKFPHNLVTAEECVDGEYINYSTGGTVSKAGYFRTGYIPVTAGESYQSNAGRNYAFYDADETYLSYLSGGKDTDIQSGITAPTNAAYIRFTVNKTLDGISSPYLLYFAATDQYCLRKDIEGIPWCYGKRINWIGDSIVYGSFDDYVCEALGLIERDYGIGGSTIALKANGTDPRDALCARFSDMTNDADIIAVSCGTNDFQYAHCPIGTIYDADDGTSDTTFYGALKHLCRGLILKYPHKLIFFTTPIKRSQKFRNGDGGDFTSDGVLTTPFSRNKYGRTLMDYADIIKEVCGYYSIPVLDMNRESLLNPHIDYSAFGDQEASGYTHPNEIGQKMMARRIAGWLLQLGSTVDIPSTEAESFSDTPAPVTPLPKNEDTGT